MDKLAVLLQFVQSKIYRNAEIIKILAARNGAQCRHFRRFIFYFVLVVVFVLALAFYTLNFICFSFILEDHFVSNFFIIICLYMKY